MLQAGPCAMHNFWQKVYNEFEKKGGEALVRFRRTDENAL